MLKKRRFERKLLFSLLLVIAVSLNFSSLVAQKYPFGKLPTNKNADAAKKAYSVLMDKFYEECGNNKGRICWGLASNTWENHDQTVSEGIAYGLLASAYYKDQKRFNGLWKYYNAFLNQNGFMHWHTKGCSQIKGRNGATDADVDAAMALIVADKTMGSKGVVNYAKEAKELIAKIKKHEVEKGSYTLKPGDVFGGDNVTNISYFATAAYKLFGKFTNDEVFWNKVVDRCYEIIDNNIKANNSAGGLVSDWCKADGTESERHKMEYDYDACRTPWRIATDYIWFGDKRAKKYLDKVNGFIQNDIGGIQNVMSGYQLNGKPLPGKGIYHNSTFVGTFACAGVVLSSQAQLNKYYKEVEATPPYSYFDYFFDLFSRTLLTGIYTNPLEGETAIVPVTGVNLNKNKVSIEKGKTLKLKANVIPANATNKNVIWSSNKKNVATVSNSGVVTAKAKGKATITVKTKDGNKVATCEITVTKANTPILVTGVSLNKSTASIKTGNTLKLKASVIPANASNKSVTWSSNKKKIVTVNSSGVVTAKAKGTAIITVTTTDGSKTATCKITVTDNGGGNSGCSFGTPSNKALKAYNEVTFTNVHVLGNGGPSFKNFKKFRINWSLSDKKVNRFAINTKDGVPSYYIDLRSSMSAKFGSAKPEVTFTASGIKGLDGSYWVTNDGDNFVMVSKTGNYTIYFSNSAKAPECSSTTKSSIVENDLTKEVFKVVVYPNPVKDRLFIKGIQNKAAKVIIYNTFGQFVKAVKFQKNQGFVNVSDLSKGMYVVKIVSGGMSVTKTFIKK